MNTSRTVVQSIASTTSVNVDTPLGEFGQIPNIRLVNKHEAAAILGISPETLKKYRLQKDSTLAEGIHYFVWNSRAVRYNAALLADWGVNRNSPERHRIAIERYLASLPVNQQKRGRRAS